MAYVDFSKFAKWYTCYDLFSFYVTVSRQRDVDRTPVKQSYRPCCFSPLWQIPIVSPNLYPLSGLVSNPSVDKAMQTLARCVMTQPKVPARRMSHVPRLQDLKPKLRLASSSARHAEGGYLQRRWGLSAFTPSLTSSLHTAVFTLGYTVCTKRWS